MRLETFLDEDAESFFKAIEHKFRADGINKQGLRHHAILQTLQRKHFRDLGDKIPDGSSADCYDKLKQVLLKKYARTEGDKLRILKSDLKVGTPPDVLYRKIKDILSKDTITEGMRREAFLDLLPSNIELILRSHKGLSLDELAELAENLFNAATSHKSNEFHGAIATNMLLSQSHVAVAEQSAANRKLENKVGAVEAKIDNLQKLLTTSLKQIKCNAVQTNGQTSTSTQRPAFKRCGNGRYPNNGGHQNMRSQDNNYRRTQDRSQRRYETGYRPQGSQRYERNKIPPCWYHERFGQYAQKCTQPCGFNQ